MEWFEPPAETVRTGVFISSFSFFFYCQFMKGFFGFAHLMPHCWGCASFLPAAVLGCVSRPGVGGEAALAYLHRAWTWLYLWAKMGSGLLAGGCGVGLSFPGDSEASQV